MQGRGGVIGRRGRDNSISSWGITSTAAVATTWTSSIGAAAAIQGRWLCSPVVHSTPVVHSASAASSSDQAFSKACVPLPCHGQCRYTLSTDCDPPSPCIYVGMCGFGFGMRFVPERGAVSLQLVTSSQPAYLQNAEKTASSIFAPRRQDLNTHIRTWSNAQHAVNSKSRIL